MSNLDPARYVAMRLADARHTLPVPGTARLFTTDAAGEVIDLHDPFWRILVADGSIVRAAPVVTKEPGPAAPVPPVAPAPAAAPDTGGTRVSEAVVSGSPSVPAAPAAVLAPSKPPTGLEAAERAAALLKTVAAR